MDIVAHPLLLRAVQEDSHAHAVGAAVIGVGKLHILSAHLDRAVLGNHPFIGGVSAVPRLHKVRFQLRLAVIVVSAVVCVIGQLGEVLAVPVTGAVVPAVIALLVREVVLQAGVVGAVGVGLNLLNLRLGGALVSDDNRQSARIPCVVSVGRNLEAEDVAPLHVQLLEVEGHGVVIAVALQRLDLLLEELAAVLADGQGHTVRPVRVAVIVTELHIAALDVQLTVLCGNPLINGVLNCAGMHIVPLHLKAVVLGGLVGVPVQIGEQLGIVQRGAL